MNRPRSSCVAAFLAGLLSLLPPSTWAAGKHVPSGLDHANLAVGNFTEAEDLFERLGFVIKPGRPHKNSIVNSHLKFTDGTELELISAREPLDSLAAEYLRFVAAGDGGAFVALRVASVDSLVAQLEAARIPARLSRSTGMRACVFSESHPLRPLWFLEFRRPYVDRPEYTTHRNGSSRLRAVWLSSSLGEEVEHLFDALEIGARPSEWPLPGSQVFSLGANEIYVIPLQEPSLRPFVGATFDVDRLDDTAGLLHSRGFPFTRHEDRRGQSLRLVLPGLSGFRLEFLQPTEALPRPPSPRNVVPR